MSVFNVGRIPLREAARRGGIATRVVRAPGWGRRIGFAGIFVIVAVALLAPVIEPYSPTHQDLTMILHSPTWQHPFGTDELGQDILSRVLASARVDLSIGAVGVSVAIVVGTFIGLMAGYYGRWLDIVVGRVVDVFTAFPFLVLVIAIVAMLGPGLRNLYIAIALVSWVAYARIVRGQTLSAKNKEYVLAARALGYSDARIMFRHLLPNVIAPAIVFSMSDFVLDMLAGASLGFFGLGVQPPGAEWGAMIADGRNYMLSAPWMVIFPGLAIIVTGLFFSLAGDGIADYIRRVDGG
jgi:peptide/nickel transport system permease protein